MSSRIFLACAVSAMGGFLASLAVTPLPYSKNDCNVYKVAPRVVTSFVLKAPEQPAPAPVIVKEKCETVAPVEPAVEAVEEKPQHSRRRHRRYRSYWR